MARRRPPGRGTTYYDEVRGRWIAEIPIGGRRVRRVAPTQKAAEAILDQLRAEREGGIVPEREHLGRYLESKRVEGLRRTTLRGYESNIRHHITPAIGHIPLEKLTPLHVQRMLDTMRGVDGRELAAATIVQVRRITHSALADAERLRAVSHNAAAGTKAPRVRRPERRTFSPTEARRFLDSVAGDRLEALYNVVCTLGLRQGELLGLRWRDVDDGVIRIVQTTYRFPGEYVHEETKSDRSERTLPLPAFVGTMLRAHRARQLEEFVAAGARPDHDLVFTAPTGRPLNGSWLTRSFKERAAELGLPRITFHDLRHCAASLLQSQGFSAREIQDVLGHATYATTMDIYTHVPPEELADKMSRLDAWRSGGS